MPEGICPLPNAVRLVLCHRVMVYRSRTAVFD